MAIARVEDIGMRHVRVLSLSAVLVAGLGVCASMALWFGIMMSNGTGDEVGTGPYYPPLLVLDVIVIVGLVALVGGHVVEARRRALAVRCYLASMSVFAVVLAGFALVLGGV